MLNHRRYGAVLGACAAALALAAAGGAEAGSYSFTFVGNGQNVSGIIGTSSSSDPALITSLSGTDNGTSISLVSVGNFGVNDNSFFAAHDSGLQTYLDFNGFDFSSNNTTFNIFSTDTGSRYAISAPGLFGDYGVFTATPADAMTPPTSVSAAPEPSTWALMLGGIGMLGAFLRMQHARRREDEFSSIATA